MFKGADLKWNSGSNCNIYEIRFHIFCTVIMSNSRYVLKMHSTRSKSGINLHICYKLCERYKQNRFHSLMMWVTLTIAGLESNGADLNSRYCAIDTQLADGGDKFQLVRFLYAIVQKVNAVS